MTRRTRPNPLFRYVYVIGPVIGLQKIGMATDPQTRLAALQTACPVDLVVHAAIAVPFGSAPEVERQAHRLMGRVCVRSEWFEATPAEAVAAVCAAAGPWMARGRREMTPGAPAQVPRGRSALASGRSKTWPRSSRAPELPLFRTGQQS